MVTCGILVQRHPAQLASHPLWLPVPLMDSQTLAQTASVAYNPFNGCFSREQIEAPLAVRGGILAGEALIPPKFRLTSGSMSIG